MALTSPALTLAVESLFGACKPALDALRKLGSTDFSDGAPGIDLKPGATIKYPISSIAAASAYNDSTNNYLSGGETTWGSLTATHYLQGFDLKGENLDQGVNAPRIKQVFSLRAGASISAAVQAAVKTALDAVTLSTGVTVAAAASSTLAGWMGVAGSVSWLDKSTSILAVNGATLAEIKGLFAAANIVGTNSELGSYLGFADMVLVPGMTARALICPTLSIGFVARVPKILAKYEQAGVETDPDSGLSIGIVVANDQGTNRQVCNADLWFGAAILSANAAATTAGVIKVGTAS